MNVRFVRVKNISGESRRIDDFQLSGGSLVLAGDEEASIPIAVYHRAWRRCHRWLANLDSLVRIGEERFAEKKRREKGGAEKEEE
jgi:hypothetical protein